MTFDNFEIVSLAILLPIAALVTYFLIPPFKKKMLQLKITGIDQHKLDKPIIPEMGGLVILIGFYCAVIPFLIASFFLYSNPNYPLVIEIILLLTFLVGLVGIWDDIKRRNPEQKGLRQYKKVILTIIISTPLAILIYYGFINYGLWGEVYFLITVRVGILYAIVLAPAAFAGCANAVNMLGGYNGLEASIGVIICASMGFFYLYQGLSFLPVILFSYGVALLAFLRYNRYPSSIFPGDTMTYSFGALIACCVILGNVVKTALLFGAITAGLWIVEFFVKLLTRFKRECFAKVNPDGSLDIPDTGYSSLTHVAIFLIKKIKGKCHEKDVTFTFIIVQIILSILAWIFSIFF
jgi:UDP-N-acetylglucosamine--dolichyl-phosphate N-acetylglucosaminephosphotransferase